MKKLIFLTAVFGLFVVVGIASASTADVLQPASTITYNEEVVINDTLRVDSAYIGSTEAGVGGVTFFNGTMINNSVDTDGESTIPLTLGDDVRIDGRLWRGETAGTDDDMPFIVNDNVEISGDLTVTGTISNYYTNSEVDALVSGGHDHIGETWTGSVATGATVPSIFSISNTGAGAGLVVTTSQNSPYPAISAGRAGSTSTIYGQNTGSGAGVTGIGNAGYGVFARSTSSFSLYVDGPVGINADTNKALGTDTITSGQTTKVISNSSVTSGSRILLTIGYAGYPGNAPANTNGGVRMQSVTAGTNFTVATMDGNAASANIPFSYLIIN
ncbi:MAG: hypothetical protein HQ538_01035 [Parcubacteria group bacterium]|nr:hypothetical protein [Parcubacteria group bacterium]